MESPRPNPVSVNRVVLPSLFFLFMSIVSMGAAYASDTVHYTFMLVAVPSMFVALIAFQAFLLEMLYPER